MHAPAGDEHAGDADLAADAVGALVVGIGVGADRQIAARTVVDAAGRRQPFGAQPWRRRRALGRPCDRPAGDGQRRIGEPVAVEPDPILSRPGRAGLTQATVMPGLSAIPKIAPAGGTFFSRKLVQAMTQPVSPGFEQSGVFLKLPPTSLPLRHQHVEAGEDGELHPLGDRRVGLDLGGDERDQMDRPLAVADQHEGAVLVAGGEEVAPGGERRRHRPERRPSRCPARRKKRPPRRPSSADISAHRPCTPTRSARPGRRRRRFPPTC